MSPPENKYDYSQRKYGFGRHDADDGYRPQKLNDGVTGAVGQSADQLAHLRHVFAHNRRDAATPHLIHAMHWQT